MSEPIPLEEAWDRLLALVEPLGAETVPTAHADGRTLAKPLTARRTQPYADLSAMDGFACAGDGPWVIAGEARAGHAFDGSLKAGQATRVSTGAALPAGADRVLLVEDAQVAANMVEAIEAPTVGKHIRRKGFDFEHGETLLGTGSRVGPRQIGLALAAGCDRLKVARRPRVAILECGDELVREVAQCPPDRLPASNGAMLAAMVRGAGGDPSLVGPIGDDVTALASAIDDAADADLLVTIGGASVGEHDLVKPALESLGAELGFWRVAIRPGKPLLVAKRSSQLVLGLPGNPASSYVTGFLFVLPAIRALLASGECLPSPISLPISAPLPKGGSRQEFLRARFVGGHAIPCDERDSSALRTLAVADLLIDRPAGASEAETGTLVPCYQLQNG